jgi:hypothetical protein
MVGAFRVLQEFAIDDLAMHNGKLHITVLIFDRSHPNRSIEVMPDDVDVVDNVRFFFTANCTMHWSVLN